MLYVGILTIVRRKLIRECGLPRGATTYPDVGMSDVVSGIIAGKKWVCHHALRHMWLKKWVCHDIRDIYGCCAHGPPPGIRH
jgi:hypothetical protein